MINPYENGFMMIYDRPQYGLIQSNLTMAHMP